MPCLGTLRVGRGSFICDMVLETLFEWLLRATWDGFKEAFRAEKQLRITQKTPWQIDLRKATASLHMAAILGTSKSTSQVLDDRRCAKMVCHDFSTSKKPQF